MLLLGDLQEGDVVKQEALEIIGSKIQQLLTRTMKHDLLQGADLAMDVKSLHDALHSFRAAMRHTNQ
jgi:hypothetical protein